MSSIRLHLLRPFHCASAVAAACLSWTVLRGDTVSRTVGVVEVQVAESRTAAISFPLRDAEEQTPTAAMRQSLLAAPGTDGDLLHIWQGRHFLTYQLSSGSWRIMATTAAMPETRFPGQPGAAYMVTRSSPGALRIAHAGRAPQEPSISYAVEANTWAFLELPFPVSSALATLALSGPEDGDRIRIWRGDPGEWLEYVRTGAQWAGSVPATDVLLQPGTGILFHNADTEQPRVLQFTRPYPAATR